MNRRDFLKTSATVAAVTATGPMLLGTEDKAGKKTARVGSGEYVYECNHAWGELPMGMEWQTTHNVAIDSQGHVYITHQGIGKVMDTVLVFDDKGKFIRSFGKEWHGGGHGIDIRKEGSEEFMYLCNTWKSPKVMKVNLKGEVVWKLERPEIKEYEDKKVSYNPTNVAFCPDGTLFVGDGYGAGAQMLKYTADGKLIKNFGGAGNGEGKFRTPHGNWVDNRDYKNPVLVVCDRANARLQTFDLEGKFLKMTA
ncbi:MAG: twin-arginine translocation signal domain-containing protein, partial [Fimbriiglobus sp.]